MPLSSVLSPLLRRGERKQEHVATHLRKLRKFLCIKLRLDTDARKLTGASTFTRLFPFVLIRVNSWLKYL